MTMRFCLFVAAVLAMAPLKAAAFSCDSPQDAARSHLDQLQPSGIWDPEAAASCFELEEDRKDGQEGAAPASALSFKQSATSPHCPSKTRSMLFVVVAQLQKTYYFSFQLFNLSRYR